MLESNQDRHEVTFKFPPQLPQANQQNILTKHHHKHKLTEIDKFHLYTKQDTTKRTPMAWARLTIENELKSLDLTWGEAEAIAKNRAEWRHLVLTLCSDGSEEDR